jgi:hypothetical protein
MDQPVETKRIDQILHKRKPSSFEKKDDPVHARLLDLFRDDPISDMNTTARRGLANNVHFLLMRDLPDMMEEHHINADEVILIYHYNKLKGCHRTKVRVLDASKYEEPVFSVCSDWVSDRAQALDSLRKNIEAMVYGGN